MINWEEAPEGTTHHFKDQWGDCWWFKQVEVGSAFWIRVGGRYSLWSHYACIYTELVGVLTALNGVAQEMPPIRHNPPRFMVEELVVAVGPEKTAPKKRVGWW